MSGRRIENIAVGRGFVKTLFFRDAEMTIKIIFERSSQKPLRGVGRLSA